MEVIAERTLDFLDSSMSQVRKIRVALGRPVRVVLGDTQQGQSAPPLPIGPGEPVPEGACWGAPYGIYDPASPPREQWAFGEDSMQALMLAIHILPTLLEALFLRRGTLTCDGGPWNEGFGAIPSPSTP
jgi:hypothetical protein